MAYMIELCFLYPKLINNGQQKVGQVVNLLLICLV